MSAQTESAAKRLPPAAKASFEAAERQGGAAGFTDVNTDRDAACKQITPAIHERLTDVAMGRRSVLND